MTISFIIVNWNTKDLVIQAIRSIIEHTKGYATEIIVVDNASHDGSPDALTHAFPQITVIRNPENLGFARANNLGLRVATGDLIVFFNSDAMLLDGSISSLIAYFAQEGFAGIAGCRILNSDLSLQDSAKGSFPSVRSALVSFFLPGVIAEKLSLPRIWDDTDYPRTTHVDWVTGAFMMVRQVTVKQLSGFPENYFMYCEDIELCLNARMSNLPVIYFPATQIIHHRGKSMELQSGKKLLSAASALTRYYRQRNSAWSSRLFALVVYCGYAVRVLGGLLNRRARKHYLSKISKAMRQAPRPS